MLTVNAESWLASRGLDPEIAARMGVCCEDRKIIFRYERKGVLQFSKVRTILEKQFWIEPKNIPLRLWNLDCLPEPRPGSFVHDPVTITEGEVDAVSVAQVLGGHVLSVPNGASGQKTIGDKPISEDTGYRYLWTSDNHLLPELDQCRKFILATDGDDKGLVLRDELALRLGENRCWFVLYPEGCKDANEVLLKYGAQALRDLINGAKPMRPGYLVSPNDIPPAPMTMAYPTGWECLDKHIKIVRPELMVVTGEPGFGKGVWTRALACNLALENNWRVAMLTPEDPGHRVVRDIRRFAYNVAKCREKEQIDKWCGEHFKISRPPDDEPITMEIVMAEMERAALVHDCQVFIADPWSEFDHGNFEGMPEVHYTARMLMKLKQKMRKLNIVLILVAHPTKMAAGQKARLYDISGASHWRNKADHGIILHRENTIGGVVSVTIEKSKDHETMGKPGEIYMQFDPVSANYIWCAAPAVG